MNIMKHCPDDEMVIPKTALICIPDNIHRIKTGWYCFNDFIELLRQCKDDPERLKFLLEELSKCVI